MAEYLLELTIESDRDEAEALDLLKSMAQLARLDNDTIVTASMFVHRDEGEGMDMVLAAAPLVGRQHGGGVDV